ncbi:MAG: hypothetical protein EA425_12100 [Puniceicoccaceae bacterium]|nr:MAG: hypothetical protein EA425_12100 [Puniceicoccaceae bacterium]
MPLPYRPRMENYQAGPGIPAHTVRLFRAILRPTGGRRSASITAEEADGGASCFFHPKRPATGLCEISGRLICDLCTTEWDGRTVSFETFQQLARPDTARHGFANHTRWDRIALALIIYSLLLAPFTMGLALVLSGPLALGICLVKGWKKPATPVPRPRWTFLPPAALALAQIAGAASLVYFFLTRSIPAP